MRVLLIKMSSMGDVIHTLPALTDASRAIPGIRFDWVVEENFAEIPRWHPAVERVLPIRLRAWRKKLWSPQVWQEMRAFFNEVADTGPYDLILDAQGLYKSVFVARKAQKVLQSSARLAREKSNLVKMGETPLVWGFDPASAREPLAARLYNRTVHVPTDQHAIARLRQLFAAVLGYEDPSQKPVQYALRLQSSGEALEVVSPYWVCLHGTTWETKLWPEDHWRALIQRAGTEGRQVVLPWGNEAEYQRSLRLASGFDHVQVPERKLALAEVAWLLHGAEQVVAVDTGLAHLAAALEVPTLVLYRVTDPARVGALGPKVKHLVSPLAHRYIKCFSSEAQAQESLESLSVEQVWRAIQDD